MIELKKKYKRTKKNTKYPKQDLGVQVYQFNLARLGLHYLFFFLKG
jgi:hypothetical protein